MLNLKRFLEIFCDFFVIFWGAYEDFLSSEPLGLVVTVKTHIIINTTKEQKIQFCENNTKTFFQKYNRQIIIYILKDTVHK